MTFMRIYIPTRGRPHQQLTYDNLPQSLRAVTFLVAPETEWGAHSAARRPTLICPEEGKGIGAKRQWIVDYHREHTPGSALVMIDDDNTFLVRKAADSWQLRAAEPHEVEAMFGRLVASVSHPDLGYAVAGISMRQGNNNHYPAVFVENTRIFNTFAFDPTLLQRHGIKFNRLELMEDFDVLLQLLRLGYPNVLLTDVALNSGPSNAPGGCSEYRTAEKQAAAARALAALHPGLVKVVTKTTKTGWEGMRERVDVVISWKKAYAEGATMNGGARK